MLYPLSYEGGGWQKSWHKTRGSSVMDVGRQAVCCESNSI